MKIAIRLYILALVVGLVWQPGVAGTVLGTVGRKCYLSTFSTTNASTISVFGDWIENIDRVSVPAGITVNIVGKFNGSENNSGPFSGKGKVTLKITTRYATPGEKTISLINDPPFGDTFTLTITVMDSITLTSVYADIPTPNDAFGEITITFKGTGLQEARDPANCSIVIDDLTPFITTGGNARVLSVHALSSPSTLQAKVSFTALVQDVTLDLTFSSDNDCVPLGVSVPLKYRVRVKSSTIKNYVESITFPVGNTFYKNSYGTISLNLLFAAPLNSKIRLKSGLQIPSLTGGGGTGNSKVFFKFDPPHVFAQPDGTPFPTIAGGFIQVSAKPGEAIIPITFKVIDCLGGQSGQTKEVKIQTWTHTTNANDPPNFLEKKFNVRCQ